MKRSRTSRLILLPASWRTCAAAAAQAPDPSLLTLERIITADEFRTEGFGPARWLDDGSGYTTVDGRRRAGPRPRQVRPGHRPPRGPGLRARLDRRPGAKEPLAIADYAWSKRRHEAPDLHQHPARLAAQHAGRLLGLRPQDAQAHEARRRRPRGVPDVRQVLARRPRGSPTSASNNLYVEDLADGRVTPLTTDGSPTRINGTFDWVYEEEFSLRDGFRWSPDGASIAYWQIDTTGMKDYCSSTRPTTSIPRLDDDPLSEGRPDEPGRAGSASCRLGGGETRWLDVPGDPRDHYIARMDWAGELDGAGAPAAQPAPEHRRGDAGRRQDGQGPDRPRPTATTPGSTSWTTSTGSTTAGDSPGSASATAGGTSTSCPRDGGEPRLVTPGPYDVIDVVARRREGGTRSTSSPRPTTRRSATSSASRSTARRRHDALTPDRPAGDARVSDLARRPLGDPHVFDVRRSRRSIELVSLPDHKVVADARRQRGVEGEARRARSRRRPSSSGSTSATGVELDGWCIKPPGFDPSKKYPLLVHVYGEPAGPDGARPLGRPERPLAPDARPAGICRGERRQPRHPRASRPRLAEVHLSADRHPRLRRTRPPRCGRSRRRWPLHRPEPGRRSGAGAAAAR